MKRMRSGLLTKIVVIVFAVYAAVTLSSLQGAIDKEKSRIDSQQVQIDQQRQKNLQYSAALTDEMGDEYVAGVAREKLGLVAPGERVFYDVSK